MQCRYTDVGIEENFRGVLDFGLCIEFGVMF